MRNERSGLARNNTYIRGNEKKAIMLKVKNDGTQIGKDSKSLKRSVEGVGGVAIEIRVWVQGRVSCLNVPPEFLNVPRMES